MKIFALFMMMVSGMIAMVLPPSQLMAQVVQPVEPSFPIGIAQRFMEITFPDLKQDSARVLATVATSFATDWVRGGFVSVSVNPKPTDTEPFLNASFDIVSGTIVRADFRGRRVNSRANDLLKIELEGNPQWKIEDLERAMRRHGAMFLPSQQSAVEKALKLERLEPVFGAVKGTTLALQWRAPNGATLSPKWIVEVMFERARVADISCT